MNQKLPYYMVYPMPLAFDDERIERMDFEYMKSLYPDIPKRILPYIEEECDRMEYENSMVYDEYPDKLQLRLMCGRACRNIEKSEKGIYEEDMGKLRDLVEVMLFQELSKFVPVNPVGKLLDAKKQIDHLADTHSRSIEVLVKM